MEFGSVQRDQHMSIQTSHGLKTAALVQLGQEIAEHGIETSPVRSHRALRVFGSPRGFCVSRTGSDSWSGPGRSPDGADGPEARALHEDGANAASAKFAML
jgi:hypothetical protein